MDVLEAAKKKFVVEVAQVSSPEGAATNALNFAFRRNPTYSPDCSWEQRSEFRGAFALRLLALTDSYRQATSDSDHCARIVELSDSLSRTHGKALDQGRLRIGTTQKALNLFLKTVWCLDPTFPSPPHCPVDSIVLQAAGLWGSWTKLDSISTYQDWVDGIRRHSTSRGYQSISSWELLEWDKIARGI